MTPFDIFMSNGDVFLLLFLLFSFTIFMTEIENDGEMWDD